MQNFLSIQNVEFDLDNKGLVLVQGDNRDDNNFKSNGAGKTTLNESIAWVLYGRTLKGLKADEVLHKNVKKNCMVSLEIEDDDGDIYTIIRGRKHKQYKNNALVFKGEINITEKSDKDTNEFIENLIQMTYDVFTATILYSSNSFKFTSSTDAEMKKSLDSMLNMEFWNLCLDETKKRIDAVKLEIKDIENKIDKSSSRQCLFEEQKEDLLKKSEDSKVAITERKQKLESRLEVAKNELNSLVDTSDDLESLKTVSEKLVEKINDINSKLDKFDDIFNSINEKKSLISEINGLIRNCDNNNNSLTTKAGKLLAKLDDKKALIGTECPVCGSKITKDSLDNATKEIKDELRNLMDDLKLEKEHKIKYEGQVNFFQEKLEKLEDEYATRKPLLEEKSKYDQALENTKAKVSSNAKLKESYERSKKQYESTISMLEKDILDCDSSIEDTYLSSIKDLETKIKECIENLELLNTQYQEKSNVLKDTEVWLDAYSNKGIKSLLLDNVTPFLNKRSNYYLGKLTSGSIEIEFKTQAETKAGDLKDKFTLEITNKNGGDKYAANSDGERRRIDIAVNLALQDLISSRSSKKINVAFFDECFDSLDDIGAERVIEILNENINNKSSIFVTTHNENLKAFFDKSITMIKKGGFTSLVENL